MKSSYNLLQASLTAFTGLSLCASAHGAIIFADTFDRANNTDLNNVATGKSGTQAASDWVEVTGGAPADPMILNSGLQIGETGAGAGYAVTYVDHNFVDSSITASKAFSVSVDLLDYTSTGGTRFTGIIVGNALSDVNGWSTNHPINSPFPSDFFVGVDPTSAGSQGLYVFENGTETLVDNSRPSTLRVDFTNVDDFDSGTVINYEVFVDNSSAKTGTFTWSGTNENYIGLYSNYTGGGAEVDNFSVSDPSVIPEPSAMALLGIGGIALMFRRRK